MHPAMKVPFHELISNLRQVEKNGRVRSKTNGDLVLWTYTEQAQYNKQWDDTTMAARGLITNDERIVALPFPKFFNLSEHGPEWQCPEGQPSFFEKVDGSLGILYCYNGKWSCATKGSFDSDQAKWFQNIADQMDPSFLDENVTYLVELVYPANKIVVNYGGSFLAVLGGYDVRTGFEVSYAQCRQSIKLAMQNVQWRGLVLGTESNICSMEEALASLKTMKNAEGYVIRWPNGTRVKVKCEEYILLHKAISNLSPLSVWEAMCLGTMVEMRESLPEELWPTFDEYAGKLDDAYWHIVTDVLGLHSQTFEMSPKELGLALKAGNTFNISDPSNATFIWEYRKYKNEASQPPWPNKDAKGWDAVMRKIRPTANNLE